MKRGFSEEDLSPEKEMKRGFSEEDLSPENEDDVYTKDVDTGLSTNKGKYHSGGFAGGRRFVF